MPSKIISATDAAALIPDNATLATAGFVGIGVPEYLAQAVEERFLTQQAPNHLTLIYAAGQGDGANKGLNHFGHEGLIKRVIGGHWGLAPKIGTLAMDNKIEGYNLPQGVICHLFRDIAAGKPGTLTHIGLNTFVDPLHEGGKVNSITHDDLVERVSLAGKTLLFYHALPIDIALLRGTTADQFGNISMEREALPLEALAIAQAAKNSGGRVIVQVERITQSHRITPDRIKIPGILVDHVVLAPSESHWQTFKEPFNPAYCGDIQLPAAELGIAPLDARKIIGRRAFASLKQGAVVNLGIGMPEMVTQVAAEAGALDNFTLTVEPGGIGGLPASGLSFGAVANAHCIIDQPAQFDFYDGGGLDQAFLGLAQCSARGDINVSRFGKKLAGCGGFINISQSAKELFFLGTFTSGEQALMIENGQLKIIKNGAIKKFCQHVQQLTFNGPYAIEQGQKVTFITERAVFELTHDGLVLTEVAPGIDVQRDILSLMEFTPIIKQPQTMDKTLFE
jgi:propionate CoA-transferase